VLDENLKGEGQIGLRRPECWREEVRRGETEKERYQAQ
jgi:hypothetical protein